MMSHKRVRFSLRCWILGALVNESIRQGALEDFEEQFVWIANRRGKFAAFLWYGIQILLLFPAYINDSLHWRYTMFKNHLTVAVRNIKKHKAYSFINIAGLAIGMACCILILMWVQDEVGTDRFHVNGQSIHRVIVERTLNNTFRTPVTPSALGPALQRDYPEIIDSARLLSTYQSLRYGKDQDRIYNERGFMADPSFFQMFTFPLLAGEAILVLKDPSSIVISESMARVCFENEDPLGKVLLFDGKDPLKVTGVMKDIPENSHLRFEYVIPLQYQLKQGAAFESWDSYQYFTYIRVQEGCDSRELNRKIEKLVEKHTPGTQSKVILIPLNKLYLYGIDGNGSITYVVIFSAVALFVLLIACINFMNLSTARSAHRAREVGLRKVIGAHRAELIKQFMGETIFLSTFAFLCSVIIVLMFLPNFNRLSGKTFGAPDLFHHAVLLGMAGIAVLTGSLSGIYPALFLSGFQPIRVLRGALSGGAKRSTIRRVLVITQFSLLVILLVCTVTISRQLQFIRNRDLGFEKKNLVFTRLGHQTKEAFETLKSDLKKYPSIAEVTRTNATLTFLGFETGRVGWEGKQADQKMQIQIRTVDYDYLDTFGIRLREGRFFSKAFSTDATEGYIVNEAAVRVMGMTSPLGKGFELAGDRGKIIGVVRDFHHHSLHDAIEPLVFLMNWDNYSYLFVRLRPGKTAEGIAVLKAHWERIDPGYPFHYILFEDKLAELYRSEVQTGKVIRTFAWLALLIAGLGLFGLASYLAEQRTREIGIRKVLGSSAAGIVIELNREFLKWVAAAGFIAWPVAYLAVQAWIRKFAYRAPITPWVFILSTAFALIVALLTVSLQTLKAARANPVDSLKYE